MLTADHTQRGYDFTYDGLSRLTRADYLEGNVRKAGRFDTSYEYDKHGNPLSIKRYGQTGASSYGLVDNLTVNLNGNQLKSVRNASSAAAYNGASKFKDGSSLSTEYFFDDNGCLTKDSNKGIDEIRYNFLHLPSQVVCTDGGVISYVYDADGVKRSKTYRKGGNTTVTDYYGNAIYENGVLKRLLTGDGYITFPGTTPVYHYFVKDHLGNNRVVVDQARAVEQVNHYYPFGGTFASTGKDVQPYKYNGKELDTTDGLDLYDYDARQMDPALGRFTSMDPLAEKYYSMSPYAYCANNPMRFVDRTGMAMSPYYDEEGNFLGVDEKGFTGDIYITTKKAFDNNSTDGVADSESLQAANETQHISKVEISPEAESNILTHVMLKTDGVDFSNLYNGKVSIRTRSTITPRGVKKHYGVNNPDGYTRYGFGRAENGQFKITVTARSTNGPDADFVNVETIQNYLGVHEYDAHGNLGYSGNDLGGTHWKAYEHQTKHSTFKKMPQKRQTEISDRVRDFMRKSNPSLYKKRY